MEVKEQVNTKLSVFNMNLLFTNIYFISIVSIFCCTKFGCNACKLIVISSFLMSYAMFTALILGMKIPPRESNSHFLL